MSASTGTLPRTSQGSAVRPLLAAAAALVAALAITWSAISAPTIKPLAAPAPASVVTTDGGVQTELSAAQRARFPGEPIRPSSVGASSAAHPTMVGTKVQGGGRGLRAQ